MSTCAMRRGRHMWTCGGWRRLWLCHDLDDLDRNPPLRVGVHIMCASVRLRSAFVGPTQNSKRAIHDTMILPWPNGNRKILVLESARRNRSRPLSTVLQRPTARCTACVRPEPKPALDICTELFVPKKFRDFRKENMHSDDFQNLNNIARGRGRALSSRIPWACPNQRGDSRPRAV